MIFVIKRLFLAFLFAHCLLPIAYSQPPQTWTSADMYLGLRKLNVLGSVLYVAAHPDDENTRLLAYFSKDRMLRTGYLSITRGDGGQNLIGNEQGIELGLIRTQELLSARRIDGAEQFFTRGYDFGYSKTPEETFTKWHKEKILSDVVWVIRKFQPDVIITRFPTTGEGGHGHHTASAILANEAFTAAADPTRFPEQLKFVTTWQPKRILWNSFNFGGTNTTSEDQFKMDVGGYNPLLGKSYGEIAAISRSNHKSQGFGSAGSRGEQIEYFKTTGGTAPSKDIMEGIDLSWKKVSGGEAISKGIDKLIASFDLLHPELTVKGLVELYQKMNQLPAGYWKNQKLKEVQLLIEQCSGLFLDATANEQYAVQTDSIRINFSMNNRLGVNATLKNVSIDKFDSTWNQTLSKNRNLNFSKTFFVDPSKPVTQPYWLEQKMEEGYYNVSDLQKIGQADVDPGFVANIVLNIEGQDLVFAKPIRFKFTDPVRGELYQPLVIVPPVVASPQTTFILKKNREYVPVEVSLFSFREQKFPEQKTGLEPSGKKFLGKSISEGMRKNQQLTLPVMIDSNFKNGEISFYITSPADALQERHQVKYDHVPNINYFSPSVVNVETIDLKTVGKKIGYIVGAGDKVPEALEQMGYDVTLLGDKELSRNSLQQFDAIITGVRAHNTNEWLNKYYDKLMKYVNDGGNFIVQYNTSTNIGPIKAKIGPYDFNISRTRVTDETAPVKFLNPDHPVLNFPNKITQDDFKGWIQERSIYHASNWAKNFETVFSMNDPGENADEGSLIIARHGKGTFVYTGLVFFRELPAGVPGAYRLFANLIALNKQKAF